MNQMSQQNSLALMVTTYKFDDITLTLMGIHNCCNSENNENSKGVLSEIKVNNTELPLINSVDKTGQQLFTRISYNSAKF